MFRLKEREGWIIADQVWFELYRLLRNPLVLKEPLDAGSAASAVAWYRERSGWLSCAWEPEMMKELSAIWNREELLARDAGLHGAPGSPLRSGKAGPRVPSAPGPFLSLAEELSSERLHPSPGATHRGPHQ